MSIKRLNNLNGLRIVDSYLIQMLGPGEGSDFLVLWQVSGDPFVLLRCRRKSGKIVQAEIRPQDTAEGDKIEAVKDLLAEVKSNVDLLVGTPFIGAKVKKRIVELCVAVHARDLADGEDQLLKQPLRDLLNKQ